MDLHSAVSQSISYFKRDTLFHPKTLSRCEVPVDFAYHFHFAAILTSMTCMSGWTCTNEARDAVAGFRKRLDVLLINNGGLRYGIELLAEGNESSITSHFQDQAQVYMAKLKLRKASLVNFCTVMPTERFDWMFPSLPDKSIETIHICIPPPSSNIKVATIMLSVDSAADWNIPLKDTPHQLSTKKRHLNEVSQWKEQVVFKVLKTQLDAKSDEEILIAARIRNLSPELMIEIDRSLIMLMLSAFCSEGSAFKRAKVLPFMERLMIEAYKDVVASLYSYFFLLMHIHVASK